jgi:hypothetical protein
VLALLVFESASSQVIATWRLLLFQPQKCCCGLAPTEYRAEREINRVNAPIRCRMVQSSHFSHLFITHVITPKMIGRKPGYESELLWAISTWFLFFLLFVGSVCHNLFARLANLPSIEECCPEETTDTKPQITSATKISRADDTIPSASTPSTARLGGMRPSFKKAVAYQILHLYLVYLQYTCLNKLIFCNADDPTRSILEFWKVFALIGAMGSVLYSLSGRWKPGSRIDELPTS